MSKSQLKKKVCTSSRCLNYTWTPTEYPIHLSIQRLGKNKRMFLPSKDLDHVNWKIKLWLVITTPAVDHGLPGQRVRKTDN